MSQKRNSKSKIVALRLDDGSIKELSMDRVGSSSSRIDQVIIPTSVPWQDDVQLFTSPLAFAGSREGDMGDDTVWVAEYKNTIPNSGDVFFIEAIFMEYPSNFFQLVDINEDDAVSFAQFQPGDLRPYILANR